MFYHSLVGTVPRVGISLISCPALNPAIPPRANKKTTLPSRIAHRTTKPTYLQQLSTKYPSKPSRRLPTPHLLETITADQTRLEKADSIPFPTPQRPTTSQQKHSSTLPYLRNHVCIRHRRRRLEEVDFQALERRSPTALRLVPSRDLSAG